MTHRADVARGRDVVARWCVLAEQRLEYLTELFETGRWRRYYSERAFLENIREAKTAVEIWRELSTREASRDNFALHISRPPPATFSAAPSWPARPGAPRPMLPCGHPTRLGVHRSLLDPPPVAAHPVP